MPQETVQMNTSRRRIIRGNNPALIRAEIALVQKRWYEDDRFYSPFY